MNDSRHERLSRHTSQVRGGVCVWMGHVTHLNIHITQLDVCIHIYASGEFKVCETAGLAALEQMTRLIHGGRESFIFVTHYSSFIHMQHFIHICTCKVKNFWDIWSCSSSARDSLVFVRAAATVSFAKSWYEYICIYIHTHMYIYIYIYVCMCVCVRVHVYTYIYIYI